MSIRIGLVGTHSVGKTTLAEMASDCLGLDLTRGDQASDIATALSANLRLDELTSKNQQNLQLAFLEQAEHVAALSGSFISDATGLTCAAYAPKLLKWDFVQFLTSNPDFLERAKKSVNSYTHLFYLPPEADLVDDGFRPLSSSLRLSIDQDIRRELRGLNHYTLSGDNFRRLHLIGQATGLTESSRWDRFIAFEGLPGVGKTTQIKMLSDFLTRSGRDHHVCQRFGSDSLKQEVRELYLEPIKNRDRLLELHMASFMEQFEKNEVEKRIEDGQIVISDRSKFTAIAMQIALGADLGKVYREMRDLPLPGRVVLMGGSPGVCVERNRSLGRDAKNKLKSDVNFQERIDAAYRYLQRTHIEFSTVNANRPAQHVHEQIINTMGFCHRFQQAANDVAEVNLKYPQQGTKPWTSLEAVCDLSYQVGTLHKSMLQQRGFVFTDGKTPDDIKTDITLDIGDILACTLTVAHELGINPDEAWEANRRSDIEKINIRRAG